mmetsp:Transcript_104727/g.295969  ORF Transcript_104727/g.295969 Transcript_104727/m.295969 type:complete len:361 (+) Transcript_104727:42-1124(+)
MSAMVAEKKPMEDAKRPFTDSEVGNGSGSQAEVRSSEAEVGGSELAEPPCSSFYRCFDTATTVAVNLATFAYLPLQVPQIVQDAEAKSPKELAGLAWQGFLTGALGNLLLCTYFAGKREWAAVRVQAIGAATNFAVVVQIWVAGYCPSVPFWIFAAVIVAGLLVPLLRACRAFPDTAFQMWNQATTAIGLAALLSLVGSTLVPKNDWVLLGAGVFGLLLAGVMLVLKPARLMPMMAAISGWLATLLFMFMPVPQVINNFIDHSNAKSFALGFVILGTLGNGLCCSRALFTKDAIWFTGAMWGTIIGAWLMAVSVWVAGYLGFWPLLGYTMGLVAYFVVVFIFNGKAHEESFGRQLLFLIR